MYNSGTETITCTPSAVLQCYLPPWLQHLNSISKPNIKLFLDGKLCYKMPPPHSLLITPKPHRPPAAPPPVNSSLDEIQVIFRTYPFPPTASPLAYPLPSSSNLARTHALRKRLLRRWKDDPSDVLSKRSQRTPRKRARGAKSIECASQSRLSSFQLVEGDPVLPLPRLRKRSKCETSQTTDDSWTERVRELKDRRRILEESVLGEIRRVAGALSGKITQQDRRQLKADIEGLTEQGVRDCLHLVSTHLNWDGGETEVQLQLNVMPEELVRQLQLVVMHGNGQLQVGSTGELDVVREKLWNVLRERCLK